ncbi:MAG TPA: SIS domain-containing protein [Fimbriimonadaceae bacterium]|nr:SIS domain-containing protein [Fimbriimonadaceae bacterium]
MQFLGHTRAVTAEELFRSTVQAHQEAVAGLGGAEAAILKAAEAIAACIRSGKKVLFCGNGGSAADAQHLAAEFVGRFQLERRGLPALALHTDTSTLTSVANDYGFAEVYARQVDAHGRAGDVLVAISTSGNSESILRAATRAREADLTVVAMTGSRGGKLKDLAAVWIAAPSDVTTRIQECHILIGHFLCEWAEREAVRG